MAHGHRKPRNRLTLHIIHQAPGTVLRLCTDSSPKPPEGGAIIIPIVEMKEIAQRC